MVRDKVRIRFRKGGDLRLVSHHDLMRCFERMLRRANIPFHSTEGFNPKPCLVFAQSLALGIIGAEEVAELELDGAIDAEEIHRQFAAQAPPGLEIHSVCRIDPKRKARVRRACYRVAVPSNLLPELPHRRDALLAAAHCWVERTRPRARKLDVRPYINDIRLGPDYLEMDMWVTPTGAARPDEVLGLLGLGHLLEEGAVLERTTLELYDECAVPQTPVKSIALISGNEEAAPVIEFATPGSERAPGRDGLAAAPVPGYQPEGNS